MAARCESIDRRMALLFAGDPVITTGSSNILISQLRTRYPAVCFVTRNGIASMLGHLNGLRFGQSYEHQLTDPPPPKLSLQGR